MAGKTVVSMNPEGRLTVPAEARRALQIEGETQFEVEVAENALILRLVTLVPSEDAWSATPENRRLLEQALADAREGRVLRLTEHDLERLIGE